MFFIAVVLESQFRKFFNLFKAKRTIKYIWSMRKKVIKNMSILKELNSNYLADLEMKR